MRILFLTIWALLFLISQLHFRMEVGEHYFSVNFYLLLVIYAGFNFPFFRGGISVVVISFIFETFSLAPHGFYITGGLVLFLLIHFFVDQLYSEAYITKSAWSFVFCLIGQILIRYMLEGGGVLMNPSSFWIVSLAQSFIDAVVSFPLYIVLDKTLALWMKLGRTREVRLTGADFYQVQSKQRRFLK